MMIQLAGRPQRPQTRCEKSGRVGREVIGFGSKRKLAGLAGKHFTAASLNLLSRLPCKSDAAAVYRVSYT